MVWIREVWRKYTFTVIKDKSLLILDSATSHITDSVKELF